MEQFDDLLVKILLLAAVISFVSFVSTTVLVLIWCCHGLCGSAVSEIFGGEFSNCSWSVLRLISVTCDSSWLGLRREMSKQLRLWNHLSFF